MGLRHFTSESVTEGHPDKICDQISDAVLDALLAQDKHSRVACETLIKGSLCVVAGEQRSRGNIELSQIVRQVLAEIGYSDESSGCNVADLQLIEALEPQSPDIAQGVDAAGDHPQGAGDQGMMFGYACNETPELMPLPITLSHRLARRLAEARKAEDIVGLGPDGKVQVTVAYDDARPVGIETVLISTQHAPEVASEALRAALIAQIIEPTLQAAGYSLPALVLTNPTGRFTIGGPAADAGLTGRKIIVDTYGGMGRHGGGAFSGKDASKVDRSAAYYARYIAKNVVAAGLASRCEVQLAYAIGRASPVSLFVETFGTARVPEAALEAALGRTFDARPAALIAELDLLRPVYRQTSCYGHFGRTDDALPWERTDKAAQLQAELRPLRKVELA